MKVEVDVKGVKEMIELIREKNTRLKGVLPESIRDAVIFLHGQVVLSIHHGNIGVPKAVKTGLFGGTIQWENIGINEAKVFSDLEYAWFIEKGTSKMQERPHFKNTMFVNQNKILEDFNAKVKQVIK